MADEKKKITTEKDVARILGEKYLAPEWIFITQVRNQTGYERNTRTADAMALSTYPSRGMEVNGFEIKVSKSDLMMELMQPDKSAEIQRFCDRWWLAINDPKMIENVSIPITWGVIDVSTGKCKILRKAPDLKREMFTREFVSALLRNTTQGFIHPHEVERIRQEAEDSARRRMERGYAEYEELKKTIEDFERESGLNISNTYDRERGAKVGKAVKFVLEGKENMSWRVKSAIDSARTILTEFEKLHKAL